MALFNPARLGDLNLPNRILLAPLGRGRNDPGTRSPQERSAIYYRQRASAGLLISEATHISPGTVSRPGTGAIHTPQQIAAWRKVTQAVHDADGRIFQQLFHLGRKADPDLLPAGEDVIAPSSIAAAGEIPAVGGGRKPFPLPRELRDDEIPALITQFAEAAGNSIAAGFDGVELHAANGFLIEQFLRDDTNRREDEWGGSVENRARFLLAAVDAAIAVIGAPRLGVRISPHFKVDGPGISDPEALYGHVATELGRRGIAYLHLIEADEVPPEAQLARKLRTQFGGPLVLAENFDRDRAVRAIEEGRADLVAFGRLYIANPDLVERFRLPAPLLNAPDTASFLSGGDAGYIDYPTLAEAGITTAR